MRNRKHSIIDRLDAPVRESVEEMIRAGLTYSEIVDYVRGTGTEISMASVCRYARQFSESVERIRMAQENFRGIMEETAKYPNMDPTDGILRLISHQLLEAINDMPEEERKAKNFDELIKSSVALTRAVAYKKRIDTQNKELLENGLEQFSGALYDAMASERPDLYAEIKRFLAGTGASQ